MTMQIGDIIETTGYDEVAHAGCDYGDVVVLNNNSTHYIVVSITASGEQRESIGRVEATFCYDPTIIIGRDCLNAYDAYRASLEVMMRVALLNANSLKEMS